MKILATFLMGLLLSSCSSYKVIDTQEMMASSVDRNLRLIDYRTDQSRTNSKITEMYSAKEVKIEEQHLVNNNETEFIGSWIKIYIKDSPRITNIGSLGFTESFASEVVHEIRSEIKNWYQFQIVEVQVEKSRKRAIEGTSLKQTILA